MPALLYFIICFRVRESTINILSSYLTLVETFTTVKGSIENSCVMPAHDGLSTFTGVDAYSLNVTNTTIAGFQVGLSLGGPLSLSYSTNSFIVNSNIYRNSLYNIHVTGASSVVASGNWWGTANSDEIDAKIYDASKDINLGEVDFNGYATDLIPQQC